MIDENLKRFEIFKKFSSGWEHEQGEGIQSKYANIFPSKIGQGFATFVDSS